MQTFLIRNAINGFVLDTRDSGTPGDEIEVTPSRAPAS